MSRPDASRPSDDTPDWLVEILSAAAERLTFFTDAVAAIALTLLAIELPVPTGQTSGQVMDSIIEHRDEYLAFVISFLVIAAHWRFHHTLYRYVRRVSHRLVRLNFAWLFMLVITPFTTKLISSAGDDLLSFAIYAATEALQFGLMGVMAAVILHQGLAHPQLPASRLKLMIWRVIPFAVAFAISIPIYPLIGGAGYWTWAIVPLIGRLVSPVVHRRLNVTSSDDD